MSASKHETATSYAFRRAGYMPPEDRLATAARHIVEHERDPEKRAQALLDMLQNHPDALLVLAEPALKQRAAEYCRSVAMEVAAEGGGRWAFADEADKSAPSPNPSPQGARAGHWEDADEANGRAPARDTSAPADGREGQRKIAEKARLHVPSRPTFTRPTRNVIAKPPAVPPGRKTETLERLALSKLDTFLLNGWPIGDLTPPAVRSGIQAIDRQVDRLAKERRYAELLLAGIPDNMTIRNAVRPEEADRIYREVFDV